MPVCPQRGMGIRPLAGRFMGYGERVPPVHKLLTGYQTGYKDNHGFGVMDLHDEEYGHTQPTKKAAQAFHYTVASGAVWMRSLRSTSSEAPSASSAPAGSAGWL